ncbi:MAG: peptidylprolyl isomerase [Erysipelotrichaceae bacterium]|nr:peptidylprolyl isomerase [Erysipelotrichaceae bacterium]MCI9523778.1 peptidylprolyl isomerase [Erysipelotrichaceae bacterium]
MKKLLFCFMTLLLFTGCDSTTNEEEKKEVVQNVELIQFQEPQSGDYIATLNTSMGYIKIHLFTKEAPKAVENFVTHAKNGYYNNVIFHRVIQDFMIQSGDPQGTGYGGESIWQEPFEDEFSDQLYNFRGALSMANSGVNSNGSQFFIVQNSDGASLTDDMFKSIYQNAKARGQANADFIHPNNVIKKYQEIGGAPHLDHMHTVFGQVIEGMDVVDQIANSYTNTDDKPIVDVLIYRITIEEVN